MSQCTSRIARRAILAGTVAAFALPAVVPAVALAAGTVSKTSTRMSVAASPGYANALKVYVVGAAFIAEDKPTLTLTAGAGCLQLTAYRVGCSSAGLTEVDVKGGDLNDTLDVDVPVKALLWGDAGIDSLRGVGAGQKVLSGGPGSDTVTYAGLTTPVYASLDATGNDGPFDGAPDFIGADVEALVGGSGGDLIEGGTYNGSAGTPSLNGGPGHDSIAAGSTGAFLIGGAGDDYLTGGAGNDYLGGNEGKDNYDGKGGNDTIYTQDGVTGEKITCGAGTDSLYVDVWDAIQDPANCESVVF